MAGVLWGIAIILLILWIGGLVLDILGGAIHVLLAVAVAAIIWNVITSRRAA